MTVFKIRVPSTSDVLVSYTLVVDTEKNSVECSCKAGRIIGRCKHMRFYKALIRQLLAE